ncbi:MAG: hypothetical protein OQK97_00820 [Deltaproteobacteria bacterium]|jgi:hypothetical protein|nr:hypothetical protein [Deltaproteobacteria bacterium]MCW8893478.1 hypothetical protein [Deltaproteobacteria bacterium]
MLRTAIIAFLSILCLSGCSSTTKSLTWTSSNVVISDFKAFDIQPVSNATGGTISEEVLSSLTQLLRYRFKVENLQLTDSRPTGIDSLTVQSEVLEYKFQYFTGPPPSSGNKSGLCIVRTRLLQKPANSPVAEIITFYKVDVGQGMLEPKTPEYLLKEVATTIAQEVAKMM